jgi:hypothetical protein
MLLWCKHAARTPGVVRSQVLATCIALVLVALAASGGCTPAEEPCVVPQAPGGEPEAVELPADAVLRDETEAVTSPSGGASLPVEGGVSGDPDKAETSGDDTESVAATDTPAQVTSRVDLVYFHTANPCGCMAEVEGVIESSLRTHFAGEMDQKTVRFFSVVSDDPSNENLVRMYGSQQFDLFLVTYEGGKARATQVYDIWSLLGDNEAIALVVKSKVADSLAPLS